MHEHPSLPDEPADEPLPAAAASAEGMFEDPIVPEADTSEAPASHRTRRDVLSGPIRATVFWLSLPVLMEQFLNFCVGTWDMWLAGHLPDPRLTMPATLAVGVGAYVGWLASMLFSVVAAGTTALVARHWGAAEFRDANTVLNRSLAMAGVAGAGFLAFIWFAAPWFAQTLIKRPDAVEMTVFYLRLDGVGLIFTAISLVGSAALRGTGDMRTPLAVLGTVSVVNLIVSAALVYGWGPLPLLGVNGIVGGTVIARVCGGLLMLAWLASGRGHLALDPSELTLIGDAARRILRIGLPAAIDGAVLWAGHFAFLRIIHRISDDALAAHMVGIRVEAITYLPAVAWGAAAATMVGQSLGNRDPDRARRAGHEAVWQCSLLGIFITATFFFGAERIFAEMSNAPELQAIGAPALQLLALFQVPLIVSIIYSSALRGAGDTRYPLLVTVVSTFFLRLPLAWLLSEPLGLYGAWLGMCADMLLRSLLAAGRFVRGKWERVEV
jgi:MATE family multidrug resistance protein